jgi:hypothetical protein
VSPEGAALSQQKSGSAGDEQPGYPISFSILIGAPLSGWQTLYRSKHELAQTRGLPAQQEPQPRFDGRAGDHVKPKTAIEAVTLDGRYLIVRGRLWRKSNPGLSDAVRERLVKELMEARRAVKDAKGEPAGTADARRRVDAAKVALGERGPVWWEDGAPDYNRHLVKNTPYADPSLLADADG